MHLLQDLLLTVFYIGYEYSERSFGGGFDPMGGFGGYGGDNSMGGGGFMSGEEKPAGKGSEQKSRDRQSLVPLTVKQLSNLRSVDDVYRVDDVELHMLKLVGTLLSPQEHSTNFTFRLNDCTGTMDCKQWIEKDGSAYVKIRSLREGTLVKVVGNLREYEGKLHVLVYDVSPVIDWNELTYHLLDTILTHCRHTKGPLPGTVPPVAMSMSMNSPANFHRPGGMNMGMGMGGGASLNNVMQKEAQGLHEVIFKAYLKGMNNQAGLSYQEALYHAHNLGANALTMPQLIQGVQQLCEDGRLYTTIDDEHYRPTSDEF
jgi:replication factor A2